MRVRAASVAAVASLLLIAGGLVAVAARQERHQLGTNWVRPVQPAAELRSGERLCQPEAQLPGGTGGVVLRTGPGDRPALALTIRSAGAPDVRGTLAAGRGGDVVVPIPELGAARRDARVCVEPAGRVAVWGGPGLGAPATVDGERTDSLVRLEYVEPRARSWFPVVPDIADRLAVARDALPGPLALPLFGLLALAVVAGSLVLVVREGRR